MTLASGNGDSSRGAVAIDGSDGTMALVGSITISSGVIVLVWDAYEYGPPSTMLNAYHIFIYCPSVILLENIGVKLSDQATNPKY